MTNSTESGQAAPWLPVARVHTREEYEYELLVCMNLANWENDDAAVFARAALSKGKK